MTQPPESDAPWGPAYANYVGPPPDRDSEHLKVLSICWYIGSGLALLGSLCPGFYSAMGVFMAVSPESFKPNPPPPAVGWLMFAVALLGVLYMWALAILGLITARSLPQRRRRVLCYVASGMACLQIPLGTTLGVFTLVVLSRPSIQASFQQST
jgi:hypothetical protein